MQNQTKRLDNKWIATIVIAIIFALYSLVAFVLIGYRGKQFLTAYLFTLAAYLFLIISIWVVSGKKNDLKDIFLGISVWRISIIYVVAQTMLGLVFMVLSIDGFILSVVLQLILVGVYIALVCTAYAAKNTVSDIEDTVKKKRNYLGILKTELDTLLLQEASAHVKEALVELAEVVRYSDPMSADELQTIEDDILERVSILASGYSVCGEEEKLASINLIKNKVMTRNMKCKMLK